MYDFDSLPERRNTNAIKWDIKVDTKRDLLPMWVADMDFKAPDFILNALRKRVEVGVFGYSDIPDKFYKAIINFFDRRHNLSLKKNEIIFATGVVPIISSLVNKLTTPAENVVILSPVYNIFYNSIRNAGRKILESNLVLDGGEYKIDFKDLEEKLKNPETTLMIFCNPHNPVGKIWSKEELKKVSSLAKKYDVKIISDEIHCDITTPKKEYIPFLNIDSDVITCISASKCFNLAGLQGAAALVKNRYLYNRCYRAFNTDEIAEGNAFVFDTYIEAFNKGDKWLDELNEYIYQNKLYLYDYIEKNIKDLIVIKGDATYLVWINIRKVSGDSKKFCDFLVKETGLLVSSGETYGEAGMGFIRINLATSKENVKDALERLKEGVELFKNGKR